MKKIKERRIYLDIIRIVAILMMLWNHRATYWGIDINSNFLIVKSLLAFICKFGVGLFFMVSGELLLGLNESYYEILKKRVLRIITLMLIFTIINIYPNISFNNFNRLFFNELSWFLYAYIGYLLMLPFLRKIAQNCSYREMLIFMFIVSLMYALDGITIIYNELYLKRFMARCPLYWGDGSHGMWHIVYPLIGYFVYKITNSELIRSKKLQFTIIFGTIISTVLSLTLWIIDLKRNQGVNYEMLRQDFMVLPCILLYMLIMKISKYLNNKKIYRIIKELSLCTFSIFLLENCITIDYMWSNYIVEIGKEIGIPRYTIGVIEVLIAFIVYGSIAFFLRRLPLLKRLL